ncbi:MAG: L-seryl-tRNA(Sec) selenium transferase [Ignavibacteria bacterium]|nr:L-seryl-tRNA(Sec) selenium transferase [Ignavibacteria bacterium]MBT8380827.1 L-seryl-tRNA(Sec) selenium transferase [Ignavibacteria bacterium]NNL19804.1 L-seryl-tRNA(Sec) selenium transferase [Ignavibacteriaceae bacterium]
MSKKQLQKIPAVDFLLVQIEIKNLKKNYNSEFVKYCIRNVLNEVRLDIKKGIKVPSSNEIIVKIDSLAEKCSGQSLKRVINASGIILHTNLGRAPFGETIFEEIKPTIAGYSNLEFDLNTGKRGKRTAHIVELLKFLTTAEKAVVVNNNAAAVSLVLRTFSEGRETIISRGELVEIGGSFRLPEIITSSGTNMIEVGTTNRTRLSDYKKAINKNTALIFKAYKSNYAIEGFTEEVNLKELSALAKKNKLILMYDIGSGLLIKPGKKELADEPVVKKSFTSGVDIVTFSCDKLLGGPQAGIIAGKKKLIDKISKNPLMRTYRVDKLTIALLSAVLRAYIKNETNLPIFKLLNRTKEELKVLAEKLYHEFQIHQIKSEIRESTAFSGGGSLPQVKLESYSVVLIPKEINNNFGKNVYKKLMQAEIPVLSILRKGEIHFDVLTIFEKDIPAVAQMVKSVI